MDRALLVLSLSVCGACAVGVRGRHGVSTGETDHALLGEFLYTEQVLAGVTYGDQSWSVPLGYRIVNTHDSDEFQDREGTQIWPHIGPMRDRITGAYGVEVGLHLRWYRALFAEVGLEQTFGDGGDTMPYWGAGVDVGRAFKFTCGTCLPF